MEKLIDISSYPVAQVLDVLLQDKTTKKNIIWATDTYAEFGEEFTDKVQLDANGHPAAEPISSAPASRSRRRHRRSERGKKQRCSRQHGFATDEQSLR